MKSHIRPPSASLGLKNLLSCSLLLLSTGSHAQTTTADAGAATNPTVGTAASGDVAGTFLDMSQAGSWSSGVPNGSTEAIFAGGRLGTTTDLAANKLTLGSNTNLFGASYQSSVATGIKTITLGSGGLSAGTDSRIGPNLILAVGSADQNWTVGTGTGLNLQGRVTGNATITLNGTGAVWARGTGTTFSGVWNVTAGQLRNTDAVGNGLGTASVALSNNAELRLTTTTNITNALSIGTGGGKLVYSGAATVFTGAISGSNKLTLVSSGTGTPSLTVGSDMTTHIGILEIDRGAARTINFGDGSFQTEVSMTFGLNGIVDGVDTSAGSSSSLIRGGAGSNTVSVNLANALFNLNLSAANIADGNQWRLFDAANLNEIYGAGFSVDSNLGAFTEVADVWTKTDGDNTWTFTESSGVLGLSVIPEPKAALLGGLGLLILLRRLRG